MPNSESEENNFFNSVEMSFYITCSDKRYSLKHDHNKWSWNPSQNKNIISSACASYGIPIVWIFRKIISERFNSSTCYCSGSLEPESSCHDRDWIMELPMEADILIFTGILTPEDASVASCFPFDITISLSWFPLLSIPPLHSAIP